MSQEDFMAKDECIVLDIDDNIIDHKSKVSSSFFFLLTALMACIFFLYVFVDPCILC